MRALHQVLVWTLLAGFLSAAGCRNIAEWRRNGFKVGPDYQRPSAQINEDWVGVAGEEQRFEQVGEVSQQWWGVFDDPILDNLIEKAYANNRDVKTAVYRVVEANQIRLETRGNLFPQAQFGNLSFARQQASLSNALIPGIPRVTNTWLSDLNLSWELDFWGRIRRSITAAEANVDAAIENLDDVLVSLVSTVALTYMEIRSLDERIDFAHANIKIQQKSLKTNEVQLKFGKIGRLDVEQAKLVLKQTEASIPQLQLRKRQLQNSLSVLLGMPPMDLDAILGNQKLPAPPESIVVGIPAELLRRRPDVRRAERQLAIQSEQIGITAAELYPAFSLNGNLGLSAPHFSKLFRTASVTGVFNPSVQWNILNYGRILNRIRAEGANYLGLVASYQNSVLKAQQEVEDAMAGFIYARRRYQTLVEAEQAAREAERLGSIRQQSSEELFSYNQLFTLQSNLVEVQDQLVQAEFEMVRNLILVYRALGGGWEIRDMFECLPSVEPGCSSEIYDPKCLPPLCN